MKHRKIVLGTIVIVAFIALMVWGYIRFFNPTRIALINFPEYQISNFVMAKETKKIVVVPVEEDKAGRLTDYGAILLFGPGLRLSEKQNRNLDKAIKKGVPVYSFVFSSSRVNCHNITNEQKQQLDLYYQNRSKKNYRNLLAYIRQQFDGQKLGQLAVEPPVKIPTDIFYYESIDEYFSRPEDLTRHLRKKGLYHEDGKKVALISGSISPIEGNRAYIDSLIATLSRKNINVYPISASTKRVEMLRELNPDAVIYFAMGRLQKDEAVDYLRERNIPLFCPLPLAVSHEEWMESKLGAGGGFLTARVVLPEIDGALCPMPISTQNANGDGLFMYYPEMDRVETFTDYLSNYLDLTVKSNSQKKLAIGYFRGVGQNSLVATGLEVIPSLYAFLQRLQTEGYNVRGLPDTEKEFEKIIHTEGPVFSGNHEGAMSGFLEKSHPLLISLSEYNTWLKKRLSPRRYEELVGTYGEAPGDFMVTNRQGQSFIAVPRIKFGNIVLFPQPRPAIGGDDFQVTHGGANVPPPHNYIATYLWLQESFLADALIHFGTHGSLEFTPGKQTALSGDDWPEVLVGSMPHFYYYCIGNVGEGIIAKRRTKAGLISYLTPPFIDNGLRQSYVDLERDIHEYFTADDKKQTQLSLKIKERAVKLNMHKDLQLDGDVNKPFTQAEIEYLDNFIEEIAQEKITGALYTLGKPFKQQDLYTTVMALSVDPVAYARAKIDLLNKKISRKEYDTNSFIVNNYIEPAKKEVTLLYQKPLRKDTVSNNPKQMVSTKKMGAEDRKRSRGEMEKAEKTSKMTFEEREMKMAQDELKKALGSVSLYKELLMSSPESEIRSLLNALNGGYIEPSPGGDAVSNPNALPTGRNLYSINAEATPSELAWEQGKNLVEATLSQYKAKHGILPRKVSYTFWAGEFIQSEGATLAQCFYMLGVEPVRDRMGRVTDLRLIPSSELGRPRINVVVQVSGQLRDLASSRLTLLNRAVRMAAEAGDENYENGVRKDALESEKLLLEQGVPPLEAREMATMRIFGGVDGRYGTGIKDFVEQGDAWETQTDIANAYLKNMSAVYGSEELWGEYKENLYRIALQNTDVVMQPRQNNTWGALSLDHMYEFMGGLNVSVKDVTGKNPETYLSDYRNRNRVRLQELKEAIGVESRTTILNPVYIKSKMEGGATTANTFAKTLRNSFGWEAMKPDAIHDNYWDEVYRLYVLDSCKLGVKDFFETKNVAAFQEMTSIMLETARKGMWQATDEQIVELARLSAELASKFGADQSDFFTSNKSLQEYITGKLPPESSQSYKKAIDRVNKISSGKSVVLERKDVKPEGKQEKIGYRSYILAGAIFFLFVILFFHIKRNKRK
ncbi:protoporphyrin IX magnesium chelatase [Porphyromonas macacae]|uniref:cobaltochelatase subunit CobN n=1 Tax=Porphyromonas macacae TaxID=28115 RepID=UPI00052C17EB|nr:cobaltochelatase subunit CobN [Porphyromonas macacae]KGO00089.1 protoporphyrin IX magnesium chelatase [Porphyromonas macacae]